MKKFLFIFTLIFLLIATGTIVGAQADASGTPRIYVNGSFVVSDQPPVIEDGRTLVPLRPVLEALGANVEWDHASKTAIADLDGKTVSVEINSNVMTSGNARIALDVPAKIISGRTMIPVRAVSEALGCRVDWDRQTRTVVITKFHEANGLDKENLKEFLSHYFISMRENEYFRYTAFSEDSAAKAANLALGYTFPELYDYVYPDETPKLTMGQDPLGIFPANGFYYKLPREKVNFIKEVVLNSMSTTPTFKNMHYLHDGYYYICSTPSERTVFETKTTSVYERDDGTYEIQASCYLKDDRGNSKFVNSYNIIAGLKYINGKKYWSIYSAENVQKRGVKESTSPDISGVVKISENKAIEIAKNAASEKYGKDLYMTSNVSVQLRTSNSISQYAVSFDVLLNNRVTSVACIVSVDASTGNVLSFNEL